MRKGELFISKQLNYDDKGITGQACLADYTLSNKSAEKSLQYRTFIHIQGYHYFIVSHQVIFFFGIIKSLICVQKVWDIF